MIIETGNAQDEIIETGSALFTLTESGLSMATLNAVAQNAAVDAVAALSNAGFIDVYDNTPVTPVLLAHCLLDDPAFSPADDGIAVLAETAEDTEADATGIAATFILTKTNGDPILSGSVSATGGAGELQFKTVSFVENVVVDITGFTITLPAAPQE